MDEVCRFKSKGTLFSENSAKRKRPQKLYNRFLMGA